MAAEKISLYNLAGMLLPFYAVSAITPWLSMGRADNASDLKNTSDDALPNYLNSLKFKQSHTLTDVRLAVGYGAFVLAAACFGWDYRFGFDNTKYYTAGAVVAYAVLNAFLTFWITSVERGTVYQGTAPSGERVSLPD